MKGISIETFDRQIKEFSEEFLKKKLKRDELFVLWFLRAYVTEQDKFTDSLTGGSKDKSIDAVFLDENARAAFIIQGKYSHALGAKSEESSRVVEFAELAHRILDEDETTFKEFLAEMDPGAGDRAQLVRSLVMNDGWSLRLIYATLNNCSTSTETDAQLVIRRSEFDATLEILDSSRLSLVLLDWMEGVAPSVPSLSLPVREQGLMYRKDPQTDVQSYVFSMSGEDIGNLYRQARDRLFARNIRGYKGADTKINAAMRSTVKDNPEYFWYFNNGVTIVCNEAERMGNPGDEIIVVSNPQIINGQQTTRTLAQAGDEAAGVRVLVRVIAIARDPKSPDEQFQHLVSNIVEATNSQNKIKQADLLSNDAVQIRIEKELRARGYRYLRKGETLREANRIFGKFHPKIRKDHLAIAIGSCRFPSLPRRVGQERLFGEFYDKVFSNLTPDFYLSCYLMWRQVEAVARGKPDRQWAKHVVLFFAWNELWSQFRPDAESFIRACEHDDNAIIAPLHRALAAVFPAVLKSYRAHRGSDDLPSEISPYFKRIEAHKNFDDYWMTAKEAQAKFVKNADAFLEAL